MSDCRKIAINGYVTIKNGNKIIVDIKAQNLLGFSFAEYSIVLTNVEEL